MPDIVTDTNSLYTHSLSIYIAEPVTKLIVWQLIATHYTHSLSIYITKADNKDILKGSLWEVLTQEELEHIICKIKNSENGGPYFLHVAYLHMWL